MTGTRSSTEASVVTGHTDVRTATLSLRGPLRMVERNIYSYRRIWPAFLAGLLEPMLFLFSIGVGVGALVGDVQGPAGLVPYRSFVAPGLLATSAMFGSIMDATISFFIRYKYLGIYRATLATPMRPSDVASGEITTSLLRGALYSTAFLVTMLIMGLVESAWAVFAVPTAMLIGFAFAGAGLAASTWMRTWIDFEWINVAIIPFFLFSGVFFPISEYSPAVRFVVEWTPLYQGVELERALILGGVDASLLVNVAYLLAMGWVGLRIGGRRLGGLMQP